VSRNFRDRTARCRRMAFSSSLAAARRMLRWRSRGSAGARSSPVRWAVRKAKTLTVIVCSALLNGDRRTVENDPLVSSPGDTRHLFFGMPAPASLRLMGGNSAEVIAAIFDKAADDMVRKRRRPGQALRRSSSSSFATLAAMRRVSSRWKNISVVEQLPTTLAADESSRGLGVKMTFERVIVWPDGRREIDGVTPKSLPAPDGG